MLRGVYEEMLEAVHQVRPDLDEIRRARLKTQLVERLLAATSAGERDVQRLRAYALGNIREILKPTDAAA
ncbi:MAG: hypothetical protein GC201_12560 [Alphaproteobacteria bacterium]|nr:hypothetical protein [Alphaproteobacteria bacterium]